MMSTSGSAYRMTPEYVLVSTHECHPFSPPYGRAATAVCDMSTSPPPFPASFAATTEHDHFVSLPPATVRALLGSLAFFILKAKHLDEHQERECPRADVLCGNGCGLRVPFGDMKLHYAESCAHRFVPCELGCGYRIRAKVRGGGAGDSAAHNRLERQHGDTERRITVVYHVIRLAFSSLYARRYI